MAANLRIGIPDIPLTAALVTPSHPAQAGAPAAHLFGGNRTDGFRFAAGLTGGANLKFTLPTPRAADFLYVGNADWLKGEGVESVTLYRHTADSLGAATVVSSHALGPTTLHGPNGSDLVASFALTPANSYWWANYVKSGTLTAAHSKLFFGQTLDLGRDPDEGLRLTRSAWGGAFQRMPLYTVTLAWSGVSYAKAVEFYQKVVRPARHQPLVLFTTGYHGTLNGRRVLLCRVTDAGMPPAVTSVNDLSLTVEELL